MMMMMAKTMMRATITISITVILLPVVTSAEVGILITVRNMVSLRMMPVTRIRCIFADIVMCICTTGPA